MTPLEIWQYKHGVSAGAMLELKALFIDASPEPVRRPKPGTLESYSDRQLEASQLGARLWRNNVGALPDRRGVPVRFGLANESPAQNRGIKSSDLIGLRPVVIGPGHVGHTIGQFIAREEKRPGWKYTGKGREPAQLKFIKLVAALGGDACFSNGRGTL